MVARLQSKSFPLLGAKELSLEDEALAYRYLAISHNKILYTVEDHYIYIHLLWDCRQDPSRLVSLIKDVD